MAIAFVQAASNNSNTSTSSLTVTLPSGITAGSLIVLVVFWPTGTTTASFSDGLNTYTSVGTVGAGPAMSMYYAPNSGSSGGATAIACSFGASLPVAVTAIEYSGAATISPLDSFRTGSGNGTSISLSSSVPVSGAGEVVVLGVGFAGSTTTTAGTGFSFHTGTSTATVPIVAVTDDFPVSSATSATMTLGAPESWVALGASFKLLGAVASVLPLPIYVLPEQQESRFNLFPGVVWRNRVPPPLGLLPGGDRVLPSLVVLPADPVPENRSWIGKLKRVGDFAPPVAAFLPPYVLYREDLRISLSHKPLSYITGRLPQPPLSLRILTGNASVNTSFTGNASVNTLLTGGAS